MNRLWQPAVSCKQTSNRLNEQPQFVQPVVKPVWQPVWQQVVSCKGGFCINRVSILHRFRDIATFTVYVTACDLVESFIFSKKSWSYRARTLRFTGKHIDGKIPAILPEMWELERFSCTAEVTSKVTHGPCYCCHSIGHVRFPVSLLL